MQRRHSFFVDSERLLAITETVGEEQPGIAFHQSGACALGTEMAALLQFTYIQQIVWFPVVYVRGEEYNASVLARGTKT